MGTLTTWMSAHPALATLASIAAAVAVYQLLFAVVVQLRKRNVFRLQHVVITGGSKGLGAVRADAACGRIACGR